MAKELREFLRECARSAAKDGQDYWLSLFGLGRGKGGARRKDRFESTGAYAFGQMVEQAMANLKDGFEKKREMKKQGMLAQKVQEVLSGMGLGLKEIDALFKGKTLKASACRVIASLQTPPLQLKTVQNAYSLYLRTKA